MTRDTYAVLRRVAAGRWEPFAFAASPTAACDALVRLMATNWCRRVAWRVAQLERRQGPRERHASGIPDGVL